MVIQCGVLGECGERAAGVWLEMRKFMCFACLVHATATIEEEKDFMDEGLCNMQSIRAKQAPPNPREPKTIL